MPVLKPDEVLRYLSAKGFLSAAEAELVSARWSIERDGPLLQYLGREKLLPVEVAEDLIALIGDNQLDGLEPNLPGLILLRLIGRGGRGSVYRAWQISLKRVVAVKVLASALADNREYIQRFLREARVASKVQHRNIVRAFDINRTNGAPRGGSCTYMVMEYVAGISLGAVLRDKIKLSLPDALEIGRAIADAIGYIARVGLVHRDVKPDNIMLDRRGRVKLCDLGLARPAGSTNLTAPMVAHGTPAFMAPEAALRADIDTQADVYSLGVTLYRALLGKLPFENLEAVEILRMHIEEKPRGLDNGEMPGVVAELIQRMLEKEPQNRPMAQDLAAEIAAIQKSIPGMDRHKLYALVPGGEQGPPEPDEPLTLADEPPMRHANGATPKVVAPPRPAQSPRRSSGVGIGTLGLALLACIAYILFMTVSDPADLPEDPRVKGLERRVKALESELESESAERKALTAQLRESAERLRREDAEDAERNALEPPRDKASEAVREITAMRESGRLKELPGNE